MALTLASSASASKILFLVAFPGKSQWLMFEPVINEVGAYSYSDQMIDFVIKLSASEPRARGYSNNKLPAQDRIKKLQRVDH